MAKKKMIVKKDEKSGLVEIMESLDGTFLDIFGISFSHGCMHCEKIFDEPSDIDTHVCKEK